MSKQSLWLALGVGLLALVVRWWGLGEIMTVDEERWILRSSDYYEKLFDHGDTSGTFLTTHPGATSMWLMGAGVRLQETRLGYKADESNIANFQKAAKAPIAVATSILVGLLVYALVGLVGKVAASSAGILLALDPYVVGMSQVAHLDALLALLMSLSAVLFLRAIWRGSNSSSDWQSRLPVLELVGSGIAAGMAMGVKGLPVVWLGVWWGMVLGILVIRLGRSDWWASIRWMVRTWFFVAGVAALTFYVVWPALWVSADLGRSFTRDYGQVVTDDHVEIENSEEPIEPVTFYIRSLLGRLTPLVQVLLVISLIGMWWKREWFRDKKLLVALWLILYAIGYVVMISLAAKKGDRYALPAMVGLILAAGLLGSMIGQWLWKRERSVQLSGAMGVALVLVVLLCQYWAWSPHAIAYTNPLFPDIRPRTQQGWGEGLEMAAAWLNERPFIDRLSIASWYPSVTSVFFEGRTFSLSSREDHRVGYVVLYRNMEGRAEDDIASNVLDEFEGKEPEKVFYIGGKPYVWIYNVLGPYYFRSHVKEITSDVEVGQLVPVERDNWRRIDLAFATFSGRNNTEDVIVEIKEHPDSDVVIRRIVVNARDVPDEDWQAFDFEPIVDSGDKVYYVAVRSPKSRPGNAVTVRLSPEDVMPGKALVRREALEAGQKQSDFEREGDLGYRVFYTN